MFARSIIHNFRYCVISSRELLQQKGAFSEFLEQHLQELDDDEGKVEHSDDDESLQLSIFIAPLSLSHCRTFGHSEFHSGQRDESSFCTLGVDHADVGEEVKCPKMRCDELNNIYNNIRTHTHIYCSSLNGSLRRRKHSGSRRSSQRSDQIKVDTKPKTKLIDSEEAATGAVGWGVYIRYFKSIGIFMGLAAIACNAIQQACSVYSSSE